MTEVCQIENGSFSSFFHNVISKIVSLLLAWMAGLKYGEETAVGPFEVYIVYRACSKQISITIPLTNNGAYFIGVFMGFSHKNEVDFFQGDRIFFLYQDSYLLAHGFL